MGSNPGYLLKSFLLYVPKMNFKNCCILLKRNFQFYSGIYVRPFFHHLFVLENRIIIYSLAIPFFKSYLPEIRQIFILFTFLHFSSFCLCFVSFRLFVYLFVFCLKGKVVRSATSQSISGEGTYFLFIISFLTLFAF